MNTIAEIVVPRTDGKYQSPEQISMRAGTPTTANRSSSTHSGILEISGLFITQRLFR